MANLNEKPLATLFWTSMPSVYGRTGPKKASQTVKIFSTPWRICPQKFSTTSKQEDISALLSAVRSLSEQVHDFALDNKAIKDQLATQQDADVKPHDNSTTNSASKDTSVPISDNHATAAPDRSHTKLIEAITRGEFVHFIDLLHLEGDVHASEGQQVIITPRGQLLTKHDPNVTSLHLIQYLVSI